MERPKRGGTIMAILYEKKEKIAIITINRPEAMNALDPETSQELGKAWTDFRDDPDLWVGILTGAGEKAFSAGADLKKMIPFLAQLSSLERKEREEKFPGLGGITRNFNVWKPIIAAINGFCLAGGLEMALACDFRIAAEHATFGLMEVSRGIIPGAGGTQRLPRMIPLGKAMEMILLAQRIDAQEALRLGLVNRVVPAAEVMPTALKMAEAILQNGPLAVRAAKEAILRGLSLSLEEGLRLESTLQSYLLKTEDATEGPKAFAEKRKPQFKAK
jgi:E-phenylitaconyl-CoA hydratase